MERWDPATLKLLPVIQWTRYSELASSTIIIFDHLITLDDEIELIWQSSWSPVKLLFLVNRYYTLASVIINNYALFASSHSDSFCLRFFQWQGWTGLLACMIAEAILQMRLYALYSLNRNILIAMVAIFFLTSAAAAAIMQIVISKISAHSMTIPELELSTCLPDNISHNFYAFWIPILAFETFLCCLALFRGYQTFRSSGTPYQSGKRLVGVLIRDSVVYFFVMFATYLTNLLVWKFDLDLVEVPVGWSIAMSCVLGNRVILNVRRAGRELEEERSQQVGGTHSHSMHSAKPPSRSKSWHRKGKARERPEEQEVESETLTDLEMAQLREMRIDSSYEHLDRNLMRL